MRDEVGDPALAVGGVDEVALADAVDARGEVLQAQVAQLIAAGDQEVELGVVAGAEHRTGLADHPAVQVHDVGPQFQRRGDSEARWKNAGGLEPAVKGMVRKCSPAISGESPSVFSDTGRNAISPSGSLSISGPWRTSTFPAAEASAPPGSRRRSARPDRAGRLAS